MNEFDLIEEIRKIVQKEVEQQTYVKENKCKHCEEGFCISKNNRSGLGVELHAGAGKIVAYGIDRYGWDISIETKINYCPMCGRKLVD